MTECKLCSITFEHPLELREHLSNLSHHIKLASKEKGAIHKCVVCKFICEALPDFSKHVDSDKHVSKLRLLRNRIIGIIDSIGAGEEKEMNKEMNEGGQQERQYIPSYPRPDLHLMHGGMYPPQGVRYPEGVPQHYPGRSYPEDVPPRYPERIHPEGVPQRYPLLPHPPPYMGWPPGFNPRHANNHPMYNMDYTRDAIPYEPPVQNVYRNEGTSSNCNETVMYSPEKKKKKKSRNGMGSSNKPPSSLSPPDLVKKKKEEIPKTPQSIAKKKIVANKNYPKTTPTFPNDAKKKYDRLAMKGRINFIQNRSQAMLKERINKFNLVDGTGNTVEEMNGKEPCTSGSPILPFTHSPISSKQKRMSMESNSSSVIKKATPAPSYALIGPSHSTIQSSHNRDDSSMRVNSLSSFPPSSPFSSPITSRPYDNVARVKVKKEEPDVVVDAPIEHVSINGETSGESQLHKDLEAAYGEKVRTQEKKLHAIAEKKNNLLKALNELNEEEAKEMEKLHGFRQAMTSATAAIRLLCGEEGAGTSDG